MQKDQIPRSEYPRPQLVRSDWINLNGAWEFEFDHGMSGRARKLYESGQFDHMIMVPFCPESRLSGIAYKDFMNAVWYRRTFTIPSDWKEKRILLHFGAVDYDCEIWVNGVSAGTHRGGYSSFTFDISTWIQEGTNTLVVCAEDDVRSQLQPRGKQSAQYHSQLYEYTRTTGIWQTVWLECVSSTYVSSLKVDTDPDNSSIHVEVQFNASPSEDTTICIETLFNGKLVGQTAVQSPLAHTLATVFLSEVHRWEPGNPQLYDMKVQLKQGDTVVDEVDSYFGLRTISIHDKAIFINGKPVFQRLILDQGFYPDGIYTAPTDEELRRDIEISMSLGFNGARLHQKIFEPRYLYWADKLGYLVWGEHASFGLDITTAGGLERFLPEWIDALKRDYNHPSMTGWCPFNETWENVLRNYARQDDEVLRIVYRVTKALDKTRPVIDASGNFHVETDIFDVHDYDQNPDTFAARYAPMHEGGEPYVSFPDRQRYDGQPYFVSEYGGIWWSTSQTESFGWGYGERPKTVEEFLERYNSLTTTLLENRAICGFCYTQLYDVEQEMNGLYTYDRQPKFNLEAIREINTKPAAVEKYFRR